MASHKYRQADTLPRCMALAGIAPPATLSVVLGFSNHTETVPWLSLDWNSTKFYDLESHIARPNSEVLRIAMNTAESMAFIAPIPPAGNSSFHTQFYGPSMRCSPANDSQEIAFDTYIHAMANGSIMKVTKSSFESGKLKWDENGVPGGFAPLMNVYSAFSPWSGNNGWLDLEGSDYTVDAFNNWIPNIPYDQLEPLYLDGYGYMQQLWIQTADQKIVCTLGNASFDVWFEFVNTVQAKAQYSIMNFTTFVTPYLGTVVDPFAGDNPASRAGINSYMAMYLAFSSLLNGNVSTSLTNGESAFPHHSISFDGNVTIYESSSKILQHGLGACDEIVHNYVSGLILFCRDQFRHIGAQGRPVMCWAHESKQALLITLKLQWNGDNAIGIGRDGPVPWQQATAGLLLGGDASGSLSVNGSVGWGIMDSKFSRITNNLFTKPAWMCRNRTLAKAVEDLANNFTISMLSSALVYVPNTCA